MNKKKSVCFFSSTIIPNVDEMKHESNVFFLQNTLFKMLEMAANYTHFS